MDTFFKLVGVALVAALVASFFVPQKPEGQAQALKAESIAGRPIDLASLRGRAVVIDFWATWCPPCRQLTPALKELHGEFAGRPLTVVGVSQDHDPEALRKYVEGHALPWETVYDAGAELSRAWGVEYLPTVVVIDPAGEVTYRGNPLADWNDFRAAVDSAVAAAG